MARGCINTAAVCFWDGLVDEAYVSSDVDDVGREKCQDFGQYIL